MKNILIAAVLFIATLLASYVIWYIIRGRRLRERDAARMQAETGRKNPKSGKKPKAAKGKWGVKKDSYCYPEMNDVMGYEFISVVQVDEELRKAETDKTEAAASSDVVRGERRGPNWNDSKGVGLTTVESPDSSHRYDEEDDDSYPVQGQYGEKPEGVGSDVTEENEETASHVEQEEISQLELDFIHGWSSNDNIDEYSKEQLELAMDNSPELFKEPGDNHDAVRRINREREILQGDTSLHDAFYKQRDKAMEELKKDGPSIGKDILNQLTEMNLDEGDDEGEKEGESGNDEKTDIS